MTVWIIDDNDDMRDTWEEIVNDANPKAITHKFSSFRDAIISKRSFPDVAIVDITAVCGSQFYQLMDNLSPFLDRHPGCTWVIASALREYAKNYFEEYDGDAVIHVIDASDPSLVVNLVGAKE